MRQIFFGFVVCGLLSSGLLAANFDNVIFNNEVVQEKVRAGFGTHFLLSVIASKEVSGLYQELLNLGAVHVLAQKLPPQNANESKTTRLTFEAWKQTGFSQHEKMKTLVVDCYHDTRIMDGGPTYYRIVSND